MELFENTTPFFNHCISPCYMYVCLNMNKWCPNYRTMNSLSIQVCPVWIWAKPRTLINIKISKKHLQNYEYQQILFINWEWGYYMSRGISDWDHCVPYRPNKHQTVKNNLCSQKQCMIHKTRDTSTTTQYTYSVNVWHFMTGFVIPREWGVDKKKFQYKII